VIVPGTGTWHLFHTRAAVRVSETPGARYRCRAPVFSARALGAVALASACLAGGAAHAAQPAAECHARGMTGRFAVVPGSAGAGNIVYALTLTNRSGFRCSIQGLPKLRLIGRQGKALPTRVTRAFPGPAPVVVVPPDGRARATARFSPDVPGRGEPVIGACEPIANRLRVRLRGGAVLVPVVPPTRVCSHGAMQVTVYGRAP
jgi:Domain of unknown function (DUF4232)